MRLSQLLAGIAVLPSGDPEIVGLTEDSRRISPGMLFVAVPGSSLDGHDFVADAIARGASAVVVERPVDVPATVAVAVVRSAREALATLAARFYGHPARELHLIGFTGTFGKTSTSDILRRLMTAGGCRAGVLGSLGARYETFHEKSRGGLTTPAPVELHGALRTLRTAGADTLIMEVTSHALRTGRVHGLTFEGGLLAAVMPGEHTDFHRTYQDYVDAKRQFLDYLAPGALLAYDADNHAARAIAAGAHEARAVGFTFGDRPADLKFEQARLDADGAHFIVNRRRMHSRLLGRGHLRNAALALTYALETGISVEAAQGALAELTPLHRRMERFAAGTREVLDDTAAHPDSFRAAFETADLLPHRRMVVVYAIRGNRGSDINHRNAVALADLASVHRAAALIVSSAADAVSPADAVSAEERTTALDALRAHGQPYLYRDALADATRTALEATAAGDLILLLGAQGMDRGRELLLSSAGTSARIGSTPGS